MLRGEKCTYPILTSKIFCHKLFPFNESFVLFLYQNSYCILLSLLQRWPNLSTLHDQITLFNLKKLIFLSSDIFSHALTNHSVNRLWHWKCYLDMKNRGRRKWEITFKNNQNRKIFFHPFDYSDHVIYDDVRIGYWSIIYLILMINWKFSFWVECFYVSKNEDPGQILQSFQSQFILLLVTISMRSFKKWRL